MFNFRSPRWFNHPITAAEEETSKKGAFGFRLKLKFKVVLRLSSLQNVLVCFPLVGPCCRRILKEHKCSRRCWRIKRAADFTAFYGPFMMSAVRLTAGMLTQSYQWHLRAQRHTRLPSSSLEAFSSSFFLKGESRSQSLPPFPAGIKGLSSTCDPGNTFTRPEQDRHGNRHSNLPLQALAPARTLASSSSFYRWEVFVVGVGGASGVGCCCPEVVFCG